MDKLFFVTSKNFKFNEVEEIVKDKINLIRFDLKIIEMNLETEKEIAMAKALEAIKRINAPVITEHTGFYFEEYNRFPGPNCYEIFESLGFEGLLKLLENKKRNACFKTVIAYCEPGMVPVTFSGECRGRITKDVINPIDMGYDSIFVPEDENKPFSELGLEYKKKYSHRRKAVEKFLDWYLKKQK